MGSTLAGMSPSRDDAVHVAVGGVLFTVGGGVVTAAVIAVGTSEEQNWSARWFWILILVAAGVALMGVYGLIAVYSGKWLPTTHHEREKRPSLSIARVTTERVEDDHVLFQVWLSNDGNVDIQFNANILVPDFVSSIAMSDPNGENLRRRTNLKTSEVVDGENQSIFWETGQDGLRIPARTALPMYFYAELTPARRFAVKAKIWSSQIPTDLEHVAEVGPREQQRDGAEKAP